jgi:hypothetical protein
MNHLAYLGFTDRGARAYVHVGRAGRALLRATFTESASKGLSFNLGPAVQRATGILTAI